MKTQRTRLALACSVVLLTVACGDGDDPPELPEGDNGQIDAGHGGTMDATVSEAGHPDSGAHGDP